MSAQHETTPPVELLAIKTLEALPASLRRVADGIDDEALRIRPAEGEWSMVEVIGHLVDHVEVWGERFHRIATEDNPALPAFDQEAYVRDRGYQQQSPAELLKRISALATAVSGELRSMPESAWHRSGTHEERGLLTLSEACRIFATGLPEHVLQLVETRDTVMVREGPPPGGPSGR